MTGGFSFLLMEKKLPQTIHSTVTRWSPLPAGKFFVYQVIKVRKEMIVMAEPLLVTDAEVDRQASTLPAPALKANAEKLLKAPPPVETN
jgi:hypothetical protein